MAACAAGWMPKQLDGQLANLHFEAVLRGASSGLVQVLDLDPNQVDDLKRVPPDGAKSGRNDV